jgi:hypothetical protein
VCAAATKIQTIARMFAVRQRWLLNQLRQQAATYLQRAQRRFSCHRAARRRLQEQRAADTSSWQALSSELRWHWNTIKQRRRVAIHIPSFSLEEHHRLGMPHLAAKQNMQMARLCAVADPLVDVIYVSPFPLSEDVQGYYRKLLELGGCADPGTRFKIVVPENTERFPGHFSLASLLYYSPAAMQRIRKVCFVLCFSFSSLVKKKASSLQKSIYR